MEVAVHAGLSASILSSAVGGLLDRIGQEMAAEEHLMQSVVYPERESHQAAHRRLALDLADAAAVSLEGGVSLQPLLSTVRRWIVDHAESMDEALAEWTTAGSRSSLASAGVKPSRARR